MGGRAGVLLIVDKLLFYNGFFCVGKTIASALMPDGVSKKRTDY